MLLLMERPDKLATQMLAEVPLHEVLHVIALFIDCALISARALVVIDDLRGRRSLMAMRCNLLLT